VLESSEQVFAIRLCFPMSSTITLGGTKLKSNVILAPMAGVTDLPFRRIIRKFGNFLMFSEMVASQAVIRRVSKTHRMMDLGNDLFTSVQIIGVDPVVMADAAKLSFDLGAEFIDINMGCPVKKVVKSMAGAALMRDEKLAANVIKSVVNAVPIPVTVKMRLGWDSESKNASTLAKIAEDLGIQMITVHGRTRSQLHSGTANWSEVGYVKEAVSIPVIVNGDVTDAISAKKAIMESGANGVMIGRGSLGSPWILQDIHDAIEVNGQDFKPPFVNKFDVVKSHLDYMLEFYEAECAIRMFRKVLMYYCKSIKNATQYRKKICEINTVDEAYELISSMF
jgi:tRNA-dihydrouridine synthase B